MKSGGRGWAAIMLGCAIIAGCGAKTPNPDTDPYLEMNTLLVGNACSNCHAADYPRVGPSMKDVAAALAAGTPADRERLKTAIVQGTKGNWGEAIMPVQKQVTPEQADKLTDAILALAKK